jgi:two-component sensor histidine kinase
VVNELIHNALEHGFETQKLGQLKVMLADGGDRVELKIWDDGTRLPMDFDVGSPSSLGLQIVQTLVQDDLHGQLRLENQADGVLATVEFPKMPVSPEVLEAARGLPLKQ